MVQEVALPFFERKAWPLPPDVEIALHQSKTTLSDVEKFAAQSHNPRLYKLLTAHHMKKGSLEKAMNAAAAGISSHRNKTNYAILSLAHHQAQGSLQNHHFAHALDLLHQAAWGAVIPSFDNRNGFMWLHSKDSHAEPLYAKVAHMWADHLSAEQKALREEQISQEISYGLKTPDLMHHIFIANAYANGTDEYQQSHDQALDWIDRALASEEFETQGGCNVLKDRGIMTYIKSVIDDRSDDIPLVVKQHAQSLWGRFYAHVLPQLHTHPAHEKALYVKKCLQESAEYDPMAYVVLAEETKNGQEALTYIKKGLHAASYVPKALQNILECNLYRVIAERAEKGDIVFVKEAAERVSKSNAYKDTLHTSIQKGLTKISLIDVHTLVTENKIDSTLLSPDLLVRYFSDLNDVKDVQKKKKLSTWLIEQSATHMESMPYELLVRLRNPWMMTHCLGSVFSCLQSVATRIKRQSTDVSALIYQETFDQLYAFVQKGHRGATQSFLDLYASSKAHRSLVSDATITSVCTVALKQGLFSDKPHDKKEIDLYEEALKNKKLDTHPLRNIVRSVACNYLDKQASQGNVKALCALIHYYAQQYITPTSQEAIQHLLKKMTQFKKTDIEHISSSDAFAVLQDLIKKTGNVQLAWAMTDMLLQIGSQFHDGISYFGSPKPYLEIVLSSSNRAIALQAVEACLQRPYFCTLGIGALDRICAAQPEDDALTEFCGRMFPLIMAYADSAEKDNVAAKEFLIFRKYKPHWKDLSSSEQETANRYMQELIAVKNMRILLECVENQNLNLLVRDQGNAWYMIWEQAHDKKDTALMNRAETALKDIAEKNLVREASTVEDAMFFYRMFDIFVHNNPSLALSCYKAGENFFLKGDMHDGDLKKIRDQAFAGLKVLSELKKPWAFYAIAHSFYVRAQRHKHDGLDLDIIQGFLQRGLQYMHNAVASGYKIQPCELNEINFFRELASLYLEQENFSKVEEFLVKGVKAGDGISYYIYSQLILKGRASIKGQDAVDRGIAYGVKAIRTIDKLEMLGGPYIEASAHLWRMYKAGVGCRFECGGILTSDHLEEIRRVLDLKEEIQHESVLAKSAILFDQALHRYGSKQYDESFELFLRSVEKDQDKRSYAYMGLSYLYGHGIEQSDEKAIEIFNHLLSVLPIVKDDHYEIDGARIALRGIGEAAKQGILSASYGLIRHYAGLSGEYHKKYPDVLARLVKEAEEAAFKKGTPEAMQMFFTQGSAQKIKECLERVNNLSVIKQVSESYLPRLNRSYATLTASERALLLFPFMCIDDLVDVCIAQGRSRGEGAKSAFTEDFHTLMQMLEKTPCVMHYPELQVLLAHLYIVNAMYYPAKSSFRDTEYLDKAITILTNITPSCAHDAVYYDAKRFLAGLYLYGKEYHKLFPCDVKKGEKLLNDLISAGYDEAYLIRGRWHMHGNNQARRTSLPAAVADLLKAKEYGHLAADYYLAKLYYGKPSLVQENYAKIFDLFKGAEKTQYAHLALTYRIALALHPKCKLTDKLLETVFEGINLLMQAHIEDATNIDVIEVGQELQLEHLLKQRIAMFLPTSKEAACCQMFLGLYQMMQTRVQPGNHCEGFAKAVDALMASSTVFSWEAHALVASLPMLCAEYKEATIVLKHILAMVKEATKVGPTAFEHPLFVATITRYKMFLQLANKPDWVTSIDAIVDKYKKGMTEPKV